jgi:hypothetical protein
MTRRPTAFTAREALRGRENHAKPGAGIATLQACDNTRENHYERN